MGKVHPHLWFHDRAEGAAQFYVSVIPGSQITSVTRAPSGVPDVPEGAAFVVQLALDGVPFTFLNAGPAFTLDEAYSMYLECDSQDEVDRYWDLLVADGGEHSQCGWLRDRFGVSWQVVPKGIDDYVMGSDPERAARAMAAMMGMTRLDLAGLRAAYEGA